mmetsp:Transcript_13826/g.37518  ORF Transcript_13826/g.37518 Transcript_13826/m.37518 type:complete len:623 (-) Transcript_13826:98-1966(-)
MDGEGKCNDKADRQAPPVAAADRRHGDKTAADLARAALQPGSNVDFPQITELCDRLEAVPAEIPAVVGVLSTALRSRRHTPQRQTLQALTIVNEMMYNDQAVAAFRAEEGLREALTVLRVTRDSDLGPAVDENIRMLATEVAKACFAEGVASSRGKAGQASERPSGAARTSPLTHLSWERFERTAMSAMSRADRLTEKMGKNVEVTMHKAGKTLDRMADRVMQEAERTWTTMATGSGDFPVPASTQPEPSLAPVGRTGAATVLDKTEKRQLDAVQVNSILEQEHQDLQWALTASLAESHRQPPSPSPPQLSRAQTAPTATSRTARADGVGADVANFEAWGQHEAHAGDEAVGALHDRVQRAEASLAELTGRERTALAEVAALRRDLWESSNLASGLAATLAEAETNLEAMRRRVANLANELEKRKDLAPGCRVASSESEVSKMSVAELKAYLEKHNTDFTGCVEKADLVAKALQVSAARPSAEPAASAATPPRGNTGSHAAAATDADVVTVARERELRARLAELEAQVASSPASPASRSSPRGAAAVAAIPPEVPRPAPEAAVATPAAKVQLPAAEVVPAVAAEPTTPADVLVADTPEKATTAAKALVEAHIAAATPPAATG